MYFLLPQPNVARKLAFFLEVGKNQLVLEVFLICFLQRILQKIDFSLGSLTLTINTKLLFSSIKLLFLSGHAAPSKVIFVIVLRPKKHPFF